MTTNHELPADLDNLIAGLRIENINLKLAAKQKDRALAGMLFAFDDGVGQTWSADVLDFARKLVKAKEFDASQQGEQCISDTGSCGVGGYCAECPSKHPKQAEGAQGEREAFEAAFPYLSHERYVDGEDQYASEFENGAWLAWQARAALAQPSPSYAGFQKPTVLKDCDVRYAANAASTAVNPGAPLPGCIGAQPSPAPELERPEVVAFLMKPDTYEPYVGLRRDGTCDCVEPLMTVAQHAGIIAKLAYLLNRANDRADAAKARVAELEQSQGAEVFLTLTGEITQLKAKLAELEKQEPVAFVVDVQGYKRLICATREEAASNAEHFEKRGRKSPVTPLYAAPVAQAWQVPEGWSVSLMGPDEVIRIERADGKWCGVTDLSDSPRDKLLYDMLKPLAAAPAQGGSADE